MQPARFVKLCLVKEKLFEPHSDCTLTEARVSLRLGEWGRGRWTDGRQMGGRWTADGQMGRCKADERQMRQHNRSE
jgi:hypothetical protein